MSGKRVKKSAQKRGRQTAARAITGARLVEARPAPRRLKSTHPLKFIDLFAGLGGFHQALTQLGHECVFASEINPRLSALYEKNFGLKPFGDIRAIHPDDVPGHDILCAGFPCQPFSKAGEQKGLECPQWGDLIDYVIAILKSQQPKFFIVENVPNLVRHNDGKTWKSIKTRLKNAGYTVSDGILSPHMFGVPQIRPRAFIVGTRAKKSSFKWPKVPNPGKLSIRKILDKNPKDARKLDRAVLKYLKTWQNFLDLFSDDDDLPSFPIWAMEFGATYPVDVGTPYARKYKGFGKYRGKFGKSLKGLSPMEVHAALPAYAQTKLAKFPAWKADFILQNREFYKKHKKAIDSWLPQIKKFAPSFQKFEWNVKGEEKNIWNFVIQFRASGIRLKRPTTAPSLVAMTTSQVPIIAWEKRYMTPRECSRIQSMGELTYLPQPSSAAYKALGNAVNVAVVKAIAKNLVGVAKHR